MNKKRFMFIFITVFVLFITIGYASWIITNGSNESLIFGNILSKDKVTINVKYVAYTGLTVTEGTEELPAYDGDSNKSFTVSDKTTYDKINNLVSSEGLNLKLDQTGEQNSENLSGTYKYYINITTAIKSTPGSCGGSTTYSGAYTIYKVAITKTADTEYFNTDVADVINITKNNQLPSTYINQIINNNSNYVFLGFMESLSDGTPGNTVLPINTKFTESKDIYACFNRKNSEGIANGNITDQIINATSTINIYSGNSNSNLDIKNDASYFSQLNAIFIGSNNGIEIKSGATVNFCLNSGKTFVESSKGLSKLTSNPFDSQHTLQYKVLLTSDVTINGTMLIGGTIGSGSNTGTQGNISNEFVCIDLNGHNLVINGTLNSYGVIMDSVGTGSVIVNDSGHLQSLAVIYDYKGGTSTKNQSDLNICPFQIYNIPYLMCTLEFNGNNNNWGTFDCLVRMHTSSYSSPTVKLNLLGPSSCLFTPSSATGKIIVKYNKIDELGKNSTLSQYTFDSRTQFNFYDCSIKLSNLKINAGATINTEKLSFPISTFFDINLYNSDFTFEQAISFMPGSSLYVDESSSIILNYNSSRAASISILDQPVYGYNFTKGNVLNKKSSLNASNVPQADYFWTNTVLWKYYNKSQVLCNGTLYFKTGNSSAYKLAGQLNFNKIGYIDSNNNKTIINSNSLSPFKELKDAGCNIVTYDYDFIPGIYGDTKSNYKGYARPFVSYDTAYIYDGNNDMVGTYDFNTGIFNSNNKNYILNPGTTMSNKTITIEECTINENHTISTSSGKYVFYCNVFMPLTSSSGTYTCKISKMTDSSTNTHNISYDETLQCWVKV